MRARITYQIPPHKGSEKTIPKKIAFGLRVVGSFSPSSGQSLVG
jgi:hypothetical protein